MGGRGGIRKTRWPAFVFHDDVDGFALFCFSVVQVCVVRGLHHRSHSGRSGAVSPQVHLPGDL